MTDMSMPGASPPGGSGRSDREKIVDAFMSLLAEKRFDRIDLADIARHAGVSLAQFRAEFPTKLAILAAHMKEIDRKVLAADTADMAEEPVRERLADILMRRLEMLAPYKAATRSLLRSACRNPALGVALNNLGVLSQRWMLTAAGVDVSGTRGIVRAQGMAVLFACVLRTWIDDEDPGLARTMATLDRELARGQRWAGFLDDLCCIPAGFCRIGRRRPRRRRDLGDDPIAA